MLQFAFVSLFVTFGLSYVLPYEQQPMAESIGGLVTAALFAVAIGEILIRVAWKMFGDDEPMFLRWFDRLLPSRKAGLQHSYQFKFVRNKMSNVQLTVYRSMLVFSVGFIVFGTLVLFLAAADGNMYLFVMALAAVIVGASAIALNERIEVKLWQRFAPEFERDYEVIDQMKDGRRVQLVTRKSAGDVQTVSLN